MKSNTPLYKLGILLIIIALSVPNLASCMPQLVVTGTDAVITITEQSSAKAIARAIEKAIDSVMPDGTVTVRGSKTNADATIDIDTSSGVTIIWEAELTGNRDFPLIRVFGYGTFKLGQGGSLYNDETSISVINSAELIIDGGTITYNRVIQGSIRDHAVGAYGEGCRVTMLAGCISVQNGIGVAGIYAKESELQFFGGTVSVSGVTCFGLHVENGRASVSGGIITSEGTNSSALCAIDSDVEISGGTLLAEGGFSSTVLCLGGSLLAGPGTFSASGRKSSVFSASKGAYIEINGGSIRASGYDSCCYFSIDISSVLVTGGEFSVSEESSGVFEVSRSSSVAVVGGSFPDLNASQVMFKVSTGAAIAFLSGTVPNSSTVAPEKAGAVIAVSSFAVPRSYDGTDYDLSVQAVGTQVATDAYWNTTGENPTIVITFHEEDGSSETVEILFGSYQ